MKTKKRHSRAWIAMLFLLVPGFNSCEAFYCEKCSNESESFWECSQNAIEQWESLGYTCE